MLQEAVLEHRQARLEHQTRERAARAVSTYNRTSTFLFRDNSWKIHREARPGHKIGGLRVFANNEDNSQRRQRDRSSAIPGRKITRRICLIEQKIRDCGMTFKLRCLMSDRLSDGLMSDRGLLHLFLWRSSSFFTTFHFCSSTSLKRVRAVF